jgi:hypothetical protein
MERCGKRRYTKQAAITTAIRSFQLYLYGLGYRDSITEEVGLALSPEPTTLTWNKSQVKFSVLRGFDLSTDFRHSLVRYLAYL